MFNSLQGIITAKADSVVFLITGDIEWEITMPSNDMQNLNQGNVCKVLTWLYHREDQMKLYGFLDENRRNTFLEIIKVEGIGPRAAVKIMSGISQDDLEKALENADLSRLEAVPGLGKKTAQKILLSLKGKLVSSKSMGSSSSAYYDLVEALVGMGYDRRQAVSALEKAESEIDKSAIENISASEKENLLFKEAIVFLSGV